MDVCSVSRRRLGFALDEEVSDNMSWFIKYSAYVLNSDSMHLVYLTGHELVTMFVN